MSKVVSREEQMQIETFERIGAGACANLYRNGKEVYKLLKDSSKGLYRVGKLEQLEGIKSSICVFPKEVLKDDNNMEIGYIMDFIYGKKMKEVFQDLSFEQLQQVLFKAELGIKELSEQRISFNDMHFDNIMWDEEHKEIKIIDTDFYNFVDEYTPEELYKSNLTKFNNQIETLIGIRDGVLAKYLGRNKEYMELYKNYFKRGLNGENISTNELVNIIKNIAKKDFGTSFSNISEIIEKAKGKVKDYEDEELDIENWSEGNERLRNLLTGCKENELPSMFCCAGHGKDKSAYITVQMNEQTKKKIYNIMDKLSDIKDISFRFAQKEFAEDPSFTVYMNNEKSKNEIMDIISLAMTQEMEKDQLPKNFKKLTDIIDKFKTEDIGFDLLYEIGKNKNKILLENLKFGNSEWIEKSDFKKMGFNSRTDMFGKLQYYRNGISKEKEESIFNNILDNLTQIFNSERKEDLSITQKIAQKISSNNFLKKIPFINNFIKKQLYVLPTTTQNQSMHRISSQREKFIEKLSSYKEYTVVPNEQKGQIENDKIIQKDDIDDLSL